MRCWKVLQARCRKGSEVLQGLAVTPSDGSTPEARENASMVVSELGMRHRMRGGNVGICSSPQKRQTKPRKWLPVGLFETRHQSWKAKTRCEGRVTLPCRLQACGTD